VPVEFFVGRLQELRQIVDKAGTALKGSLQRVFVLGDRGIGKSSLCRYARIAAEKKHQMPGLHVYLGGVCTLEEMVRRIFERLLKDSIEKPWYSRLREFLGDRVKEVGLFGVTVEFGASSDDLGHLVHDFAPTLRDLLRKIGNGQNGLFLILDDLDGLAATEGFANWLKSLVDDIATSDDPLPLLLALVGLPERRSQLVRSQPSLDRVFDLVEIRPFSEQETADFFRKAFGLVNMPVDKQALDFLCEMTGGFPVLCHEVGDATFKVDQDGAIDRSDAVQGALAAADVVGRKYIEPRVYDAIRSQRYRSILGKLAKHPLRTQFTRRAVTATLSNEEKKVFDNFLRKMRDLGVLVQEPALGRGGYRFARTLEHLFFWLQAQAAGSTGRSWRMPPQPSRELKP